MATRMKHVDTFNQNVSIIQFVLIIALVQRLDESIKEINLLVKDRSSDYYIVKNDVLHRFQNGRKRNVGLARRDATRKYIKNSWTRTLYCIKNRKTNAG